MRNSLAFGRVGAASLACLMGLALTQPYGVRAAEPEQGAPKLVQPALVGSQPVSPPNTQAVGQARPVSQPQSQRRIGMANPASVHCLDAGGRLEIRSGKAGQYGICHLPDGRMCEEWSYFRTGECSAKSLKNQ
ncbi:putative hemolysin [Acetobacter orientalis]|uniref:Hemolysin n=1 Tax=Acetobacter orientalis TaxID=146474 RepID=A0A2Z5ZJ70_9PROT|nr:DUF333 domain-containing protein [Acetobacter orientalis]BBC80752.1 hemolysin [Acetobacter orientalis]GAN66407.1 hypothetical protein Abor_020_044 [Acetobacter orientalis]GBR14700.1 hypothetical protein AA0481_0677 [Acetobacter orientalis NRIC 0481]GEL62437.1 hypothetical protein AOR02nite_22790 [Acetobacter orientalis]